MKDKGSDEVVFKAMGRAMNKTVMIAELIKVIQILQVLQNITCDFILIGSYIVVQRRIVGLHQNTTTGSTDITDTWEPLEEGLLP